MATLTEQDVLERDAVTASSLGVGTYDQPLRSSGFDLPSAIGLRSEALRAQLAELADTMEGRLAPPAQTLVRDAIRLLRSMACRIAVVGQVKAGKSSLINALIGHPRLLPSDVNPWTTAVTRLHFKQADVPDIAAEFRFFDADEWDKLAEGGGRIRELTERLVPGFEASALERHLEAMRTRAAARLGNEFSELLGTSHTFAHFDPATLEAYVCSGLTDRPPTGDATGRYSDVTKSANLYLDGKSFAFPTVVIDTPGTNDPFLVRDEITRQALDAADVFIVVLTARQALSNDDVALLRILRGLRKDRIIVFVNRIDELDDLEGEFDEVQTHVAKELERALLGADVPIIYGSSRWALRVLEDSAAAEPNLHAHELASYSRRRSGSDPAQSMQELLYRCSGIPRLRHALDRAIEQSHPIQVVKHLIRSFTQLSHLQVLATRDELSALKASIEDAMDTSNSRERMMRNIAGELDRLRTLATTLEKSVDAFERALGATSERQLNALDAELQRIVDEFTEEERARLARALDDGEIGFIWQCDTFPLRQRLEAEFGRQFRHVEATVLSAEQDILPRLQQIISDVLPDHLSGRHLELAPSPMEPPSLGALGRVVALDLDTPWWRAWWSNRRLADERERELERIIHLEFAPITAELARAARERITMQISTTIQETKAICLGIVEQLRRRSEAHASHVGVIRSNDGGAAQSSNSVQRFTHLDAQLKAWNGIHAKLIEMEATCKSMAQDYRS